MRSAIDLDLQVLVDGFYGLEEEKVGGFGFRWTFPQFSLPVIDGRAFATLRIAVPLTGTKLRCDAADQSFAIELVRGWQTIDLPTFGGEELTIALSETFVPGGGDNRPLGLMLRAATLHDDLGAHELLARRTDNARLNDAEFEAGVLELTSFPQLLRITASKICNIANEKACVYCSWDWTKQLEVGSPDQTISFLETLGGFFSIPVAVTDCSYGEVPLERDFGELVAVITELDRTFEFTSNGQTLSAKKRANLLGQTARVHVSVDSATGQGYRRYRDHRFDLIISNLRELCRDKKTTGDLPEVFVSFIVMRSNAGEIEQFLDLMKDIGVDRVTFRNLYREDPMDGLRTDHYGYKFDYEEECLRPDELEAITSRCLRRGQDIGLPVVLEWVDFTKNTAKGGGAAPICSEPWKTAYILNRGIMPCCYGREPVVKWSEIDQTKLEQGIRAALNSPPMQELRRDLVAGRLGRYCERARSCPIVKARSNLQQGAAIEQVV